jgi:hypothetical protein
MPVMKEWLCAAHGEFENASGRCPHGCSKRFVVQEFRTAPAIRHGTTRNADKLVGTLAKDFGLSDVASAREGESVMENLRRGKTKDFAPTWGKVDHNEPGWSGRGEAAKTFNPSSMQVKPDGMLSRMKGTFGPPKPEIVGQPYREPLPANPP